jgi:tRNA nucleotidyltransferase (CCA-adding enzyme)
VRGYGHCPAEAFNQTALALIAVITDTRCIQPHETVTIECRAPDLESMLVDWLSALSYEIATRHLLFCAFDVSIKGHHLHATAWGESIDPAQHKPTVEVKGATFKDLHVEAIEADLWMAQCVVDV